MKRTTTTPGEFTRLFEKIDAPQANEHSIEPSGEFTNCFQNRTIPLQSQALHEKWPPDSLREDPPVAAEFDPTERATQIIHQHDQAAQLPSALSAKDAAVPPIASSPAPARSLPPNQQSTGLSMGAVMLLLFGLFVCLHLEAILILLIVRH
jgi:hypothetical protein